MKSCAAPQAVAITISIYKQIKLGLSINVSSSLSGVHMHVWMQYCFSVVFQADFEVLWYTRDWWQIFSCSDGSSAGEGKGQGRGRWISLSGSHCLEPQIPPHFSGPLLGKQDKLTTGLE